MHSPLVSVVIPAYNQAEYLREAIRSVLEQSYAQFEVVVVNDASPDHTEQVVDDFDDPRIRYFVHEKNKGLPATRNTGIKNAKGDLIALLDSDDYFHPEKLATHVDFLEEHSEIGVTYNSRFELNYSSRMIRELIIPPLSVNLADFVLGFPFTPSDMVCRKEWLKKVDLFDERCVNGGEDLDLPARLALSGCQFANVDRALNYRRHHSGRRRKNLKLRMEEAVSVLNSIFADPRCPDEVQNLRPKAFSNHFLIHATYALAYEDTQLGQSYLREVVQRSPDMNSTVQNEILNMLLMFSVSDDQVNHEDLLRKMFAQLIPEVEPLKRLYNWSVGRGYLVKGCRAMIWGRPEEGRRYFESALAWHADVDELFLQKLNHQLLGFEREFGEEATRPVFANLFPYLNKMGNKKSVRRFQGSFSVNQAFRSYRAGEFEKVPGKVFQAVSHDPRYLFNRGVLAAFFRSIVYSMQ